MVWDPVWLELGFQEKAPVVGLKFAPVGRPVAERVTLPPVMVVESGRLVYTVIERVLVAVFVGVEESVAVSVTVNGPAVVYLWVVVAPVPVVPSPKFQLIA